MTILFGLAVADGARMKLDGLFRNALLDPRHRAAILQSLAGLATTITRAKGHADALLTGIIRHSANTYLHDLGLPPKPDLWPK
ncbi:hypothetical protein M8C13_06355 [Crossiella sp. SN42]|uniref:hypothetical protein n=1 Tax=Crossiella sp. SN42 TaxID=2944808 RepID=UPI00207CCE89|nr:hypothetical protein [Crossiella sp. SN42]MCO1575382.1 hypothetical protein [Crossiella sp. SN42]